MQRDIQGKFALKSEDYRLVRSLRLTDSTWIALGIAAECLGMTRADYLEAIVRGNALPSITREKSADFPRITWRGEPSLPENSQETIFLPQTADLENLRDHFLSKLKLGKQAPGYKTAQKALNWFIVKLANPK
ncbi:hypothetical protein ABN584_27590 [Gloeocapsa sp. BRSZ]